ncbi:MAG: sulfatase [Planctomycetes bacterium]|nr:sulfatase [Planctomycetota bacterium]
MRTEFAWLALLCALLAACGEPATESERAPAEFQRAHNVVLIVIDTLRADHLSLYGHERATTPRIDAWAAGGTVYEHAYAPAPWTLPSMTMLFTGRQILRRAGVKDPDRVTLAERLHQHGFQTCGIVANALLRAQFGWSRGFDHYDQDEHKLDAVKDDGWPADLVVQKGLDWLARRDDRPFFLFLHLLDPHFPYRPEPGDAFEPFDRPERRAAFTAALPEAQRAQLTDEAYAAIEREIANYDAELLGADRALGRLFDTLDAAGLSEDTLVILTSDHGECLWQRPMVPNKGPFQKCVFPLLFSTHGELVYEELVHVPLVMRGPGVPRGLRSRTDASLLDIAPTVLSHFDLPSLPRPGGRVLDPRDSTPRAERYAVFDTANALTVDGRYKLHLFRGKPGSAEWQPSELYDLELDPGEQRPLQDAAQSADLRARLEAWIQGRAEQDAPLTQDELRAMRAMGYLGDEVPEPGRR